MITVFTLAKRYCKDREMPEPSMNDLTNIGNMVSHHFRKFWIPKHYKVDTIIKDAGFMYVVQDGKSFVVNAYPNDFTNEMLGRIDAFYKQKGKEKPKKVSGLKEKEQLDPGKKRTRIPMKDSFPINKKEDGTKG